MPVEIRRDEEEIWEVLPDGQVLFERVDESGRKVRVWLEGDTLWLEEVLVSPGTEPGSEKATPLFQETVPNKFIDQEFLSPSGRLTRFEERMRMVYGVKWDGNKGLGFRLRYRP